MIHSYLDIVVIVGVSPRLVLVIPFGGVLFEYELMLRYRPIDFDISVIGLYMSTPKRDKSPKGAGRSPMFNVRLSPELKA
ncbi:hypothetical protein PSI15_14565, partial [Xenorhabdus sp. PR6a]|nr:hypothetical protein [Xenorhabdus sp. PR6a]